MKQYLDLLKDVLENGSFKEDRTGTGTLSVFGRQSRYDLQRGFPAVTTKKLYFKGVVGELLWFLDGDTNIKFLTDNNIHIWDAWADGEGNLGPVYGAQWRSWDCPRDERHRRNSFDQIQTVMNTIRDNPDSRRHIVSAWNVADLEEMALVPCHLLFQFYVREGKFLDCQLYQRSADLFLGAPFNIASYALLTSMIAQVVGLKPGEFVHTIGDAHIYKNHIEQVKEQLSRVPKELPRLWLNPKHNMPDSLFEYKFEDIRLEGYKHHPSIKAKVAV